MIKNSPFESSIHLVWIASHTNISGNSVADQLAKTAASLNVSQKKFASVGDVFSWNKKCMTSQSRESWPYKNLSAAAERILTKINYDTKRPWFRGMEIPRSNSNLILRLRINHICTSEHYRRMNWNFPSECSCGRYERKVSLTPYKLLPKPLTRQINSF